MTHPTPGPAPHTDALGGPVPLYGPDFAENPHAVYARLREFGACAPVELAPGVVATLVTSYRAALEVLHDTETYSKDPRVWQHTVPQDSQILPMMAWRPNLLYNDGDVHARYRQAVTDCLDLIEPHDLREMVHRSADRLIQGFAQRGEADLIGEYARVLPLLIFNELFGLPDSYSARLVSAMTSLLDSSSPEGAITAINDLNAYMANLTSLKREQPREDLTSWLLQHPADLTEEELQWQLLMVTTAGHEPTANLIGNALARMLSDSRYYRTLSSGSLSSSDAIIDVLWNEPPMANFSTHFPRRDVDLHGTWIPAGTPVLVSYAAANAGAAAELPPGARADAGAHLAFAAGPHGCPAKQPAVMIAATAIDRLTSWLVDITLSVPYEELSWRPGPFHRGLVALPARFTPIAPDQKGTSPWTSNPASSIPQEATSEPRPPASATPVPPSR
ncbi:cytochrome P450 family protein [Streptomyces millisiae]|uniref:Cytochrome P450 n=1 Tax=Streptomyces millisiae TaxID=3075542 RepID=A0ABU2LKT4_9ACTN|nr:cytochrome P450 [Streptomyces sp. DSM 44918]MDT0318197.1 cytochrome P450 [Streptomyces sp. DSM 44918]